MVRNGWKPQGALVRAEQPWGDAELAGLYDAFSFTADVPLYLDLAREQGGRVLEVACGSGRVLVPLVGAGHDVVGLDASPHMLALAREKLDAQASPNGSVRLVQGDMRDFDLQHDLGPVPDYRAFDLAVLAVKSFAYLIEAADQLRCLRTIAAHLRPGGVLAIDFLHPRPEWVGAVSGSLRDDLLQHVPQRRVTVSRLESVVSTDLARQVRIIRSMYEVIDDEGGLVTKRFVEWPYRWTYRFEAEHLLERAGFHVEAVYGGYERQPFTAESAAMVFIGRVAAAP